MIVFGAFVLGVVSGLRTFTSPAVLLLLNRRGVAGYVAAAFAVLEYVGDLVPNAPARTSAGPFAFRVFSGAFVGWMFFTTHGAPSIAGAAVGIVGAIVGTLGGYAMRMLAIERIGAVPSALVEDVVAIGLALLAVLKIF